MFCVWRSRLTDGFHPVKHSEVAALPAGVTGQVVRAWARDFVNGNRFKVRLRDYAARNLLSLIHHEDFREESREWLDAKIYGRKDGEPQLRVRDFQKCVWNASVVEVVHAGVHTGKQYGSMFSSDVFERYREEPSVHFWT